MMNIVKITAQHKSLLTNLIAFLLTATAFYFGNKILFAVGIFALSGAITNWLAVHMLFEKIPFLYGSGIIPNRFEEFKNGIKSLIIEQFFSSANIEKILATKQDSSVLNTIAEKINYEDTYQMLIEAISASKLGSVLAMFGGIKILDNAKPEIIEAIEKIMHKILNDLQNHQSDIETIATEFHHKAEAVIDNRLNELSPNEVKEIIAKMIKRHLGWLVVWGGVFGGLIGAVSVIPNLIYK